MEIENSHWLLAYTKAKEEKRAKENLENQGFETFLPMVAYETMSKSKSIVLETMFPRYLFIKINLERDNWNRIKSTRGVSHLVVFDQKPAVVPNQVVGFLKTRADENGNFRQKITRRRFQEGEELIIKKGVLEGKEATFVSKTCKERVRILLKFVNHLIIADIPASDVGEKEIIENFKL